MCSKESEIQNTVLYKNNKGNSVLFEFSAGNGAVVRAGLRPSLHSVRIHLNCHLEILVHLCHLLLHCLRERERESRIMNLVRIGCKIGVLFEWCTVCR